MLNFVLWVKTKKKLNFATVLLILLYLIKKMTHVIEKCVVPELHGLQRFVSHLFWNTLVSLVGREKALLCQKKLKAISKNCQGEIFQGNACRKLLKEADKLLDFEIYKDVGQLPLVPIIFLLKPWIR